MDTLPAMAPNMASTFGPILACNRGYGRKSMVEMFGIWNFKVIAIANSIGSEHPIVGTSAIKDYIQKNLSKANTYSGYHSGQWKWQHWQGFRFWHCSFHHSIGPFCFSDNPNSLFGPEVVIAQSSTNDAFFAYGYHDIFDKKWLKSCCNFSYMVSLMQVRDIFCWSTHLFLSLGLSLVIIFTLCCWLLIVDCLFHQWQRFNHEQS